VVVVVVLRSKNMDKNGANAWGKNDDGTVNTSGPRVVVGDGNMGPQGGFVTKSVQCTDVKKTFTKYQKVEKRKKRDKS